jgi:predicted nucleic-acid-binding protein
MRAIDTNVLVRLIARDDLRQSRDAEAFVKGGAWVSHLVLAETIWVLDSVYALTREKLSRSLEMLLEHENLVVQDAEIALSALNAYRKNRNVQFSDCLIIEIARKAGHLPVGTFDKALSKIDGAEKI